MTKRLLVLLAVLTGPAFAAQLLALEALHLAAIEMAWRALRVWLNH